MVFYIITTLIFIRKGFYAYMFRSAEERFGVVKMVIEHTTLNYLAYAPLPSFPPTFTHAAQDDLCVYHLLYYVARR